MDSRVMPMWSPAKKADSFWHRPERKSVQFALKKVAPLRKAVHQESAARESELPRVLADFDVEALLAEKLNGCSTFGFKGRCEMLGDYIKKVRSCLRLYREAETQFLSEKEDFIEQLHMEAVARQKLEETYVFRADEHDAEMADIKCRFEDLEKELRDARSQNEGLLATVEMSQSSLEDEKQKVVLLEEGLAKAKKENGDLSQQVRILMDANKRLQEYNTSLLQYSSKRQKDAVVAGEAIRRLSNEKNVIIESFTTVRENFAIVQDQLDSSKNLLADKVKANKELQEERLRLKSEILRLSKDRDVNTWHIDRLSEENLKIKESKMMLDKEFEQLSVKVNAMEEAYNGQIDSLSSVRSQLVLTQQKLKDLKGNVRVFCRVRPLVAEVEEGNGSLSAVYYPTSAELAGRGVELVQSQGLKHSFVFDKVFGPDVKQDDVFVEVSQLVQSALDGYKVCIFAYGQTGSGKTHTMLGNDRPDLRGIIPRSLEQILKTSQDLSSTGWTFRVKASMVEIYNDSIRDLLATPGHGNDKQHVIKHDAHGNTIVTNLTIIDVCNWKEASCLLQRATETRSVGKTAMNEVSSRSHCVFTLRISGTNESTDQHVEGVLNLIDLAGSERLSRSASTGDRLEVTQAINKSLSAIGDVINNIGNKDTHVPYSNSKLTHLLQVATRAFFFFLWWLIDLAGFERLSRSASTGDRLKVTQAVNKSLSALGDVTQSIGNKDMHLPYRNSKVTYLLQVATRAFFFFLWWLIDLAGFERLCRSASTGDRLKETQAIDESLSALGDVIKAIGNKDTHVPYRNSKLTYLLQPYLGGDSKTLMVVNVAPEMKSVTESLCSLQIAAKINACEIGNFKRTHGHKHKRPSVDEVDRYSERDGAALATDLVGSDNVSEGEWSDAESEVGLQDPFPRPQKHHERRNVHALANPPRFNLQKLSISDMKETIHRPENQMNLFLVPLVNNSAGSHITCPQTYVSPHHCKKVQRR